MVIDSKVAGLGDAWMRLMALYSLSALRRGERHTLLVAPALLGLARRMFADRLDVRGEGAGEVSYTHLGLRHVGWEMARGRRYVFPFFWLKRSQRARTRIKDRLNDGAILAASATGRLWLPDRTKQDAYQGYMELQALPSFRDVGREEFDAQAARDFAELGPRFREGCAGSGGAEIVVFPSGTAHQVMPPDWAARHLPEARFAFHAADSYAAEFYALGLRIDRFQTPEEMIALGAGARRILATDSFPSHLWQVFSERVVLLMSQQLRSRIVHPGFPDGQVIASRAVCCPCCNLDRGSHPLCSAGRVHCATWADPAYVAAFERMIA